MRRFTLAQLKKESTLDRPLFAIDGNVYDMTDFVDTHPGKLLDCS
jgi:cytochrome b involved in lipid metabolism